MEIRVNGLRDILIGQTHPILAQIHAEEAACGLSNESSFRHHRTLSNVLGSRTYGGRARLTAPPCLANVRSAWLGSAKRFSKATPRRNRRSEGAARSSRCPAPARPNARESV